MITKLRLLSLFISSILVTGTLVLRAQPAPQLVPVFGPETFTRSTAAPRTITRTFAAPNPGGSAVILIQNGEGNRGRVSSALVSLNGVRILLPNDFDQQVDSLEKAITLEPENQITVQLRSAPGSSLRITVLNEASPVSPIQGVTLRPDAIFVNEPQEIVLEAKIPYDPIQGVPQVTLERLDSQGNPVTVEGTLTDDGNLANADEIAGDGIFTLRKTFLSTVEERIPLRIAVIQGVAEGVSAKFYLDSFAHLTSEQLAEILSLQDDKFKSFNDLIPTLGREGARNTILEQLQANPAVLQAGISESGEGIWLLYKAGVLGALSLNPPGTRGGSPPGTVALNNGPIASVSAPSISSTLNDNEIGTKKAIVLAPMNTIDPLVFGSNDEGPVLRAMLENSDCPKFKVTYLADASVTVDVIKGISGFGIVAITSHGDSYYKGILSLWFEQFGWNFFFGQCLFLTGHAVTDANKITYETDLKKGRLAIVGPVGGASRYGILPSFISYYRSAAYPKSLVYIGACRSTWNDSLADAFLGAGAETYLGYSEYVDSGFANQVSVDFFTKFITDPLVSNAGEAFTSGQSDGKAEFEMIGSKDLEKPPGGLQNGDFEDASLGAWEVSGDGRVLTQLGGFVPPGGIFMGIISTGLGFTASSGEVSQTLCLPEDATTLNFSWNFSSEEFIEYCGTPFQDFLRVTITTENGTELLFNRRVDDLCGSVSQTSLHFDTSLAPCTPVPDDVGFGTGGNDCMVWSTGWHTESIDISSIATAAQGKPVTLHFAAGDVGDSIFDTAVLLDDIEIVTP